MRYYHDEPRKLVRCERVRVQEETKGKAKPKVVGWTISLEWRQCSVAAGQEYSEIPGDSPQLYDATRDTLDSAIRLFELRWSRLAVPIEAELDPD